MGYKVPDWKKSIDQNLFEVEVGEETFHVIKAEYMTGVQVEMLQRAGNDPGGLYGVLDELCPGLGTALRPVPLKFVTEFVQAWQADSGIELGESSASPSSSVSTKRPSATTS